MESAQLMQLARFLTSQGKSAPATYNCSSTEQFDFV
jgi:hypothetical protein